MNFMLLRLNLVEMWVDCRTHAYDRQSSENWAGDIDGGVTVMSVVLAPCEWESSPWGTLAKVKGHVSVNEERRKICEED